jgi:hypothetical protein
MQNKLKRVESDKSMAGIKMGAIKMSGRNS